MKRLLFVLALLMIMAGNAMSQTVCPPTPTGLTINFTKPVINGQVLHTFYVCDPDALDTHVWSIPIGNVPILWGMSNGELTITNAAAINSGILSTYNFTIRVTDAGGLYSEEPITLVEQNSPPIVGNQAFSVPENSPIGTVIGTVLASDPNLGQLLTYSIFSGNTGNVFALNSTTGVLSVAANALNFEATSSYTLVVKITDNGTNPQSSTANVAITIVNVNEAPIITN